MYLHLGSFIPKLVKVEPIEYHYKMKGNRNPRIIRYRRLSFSSHITQVVMDRIIQKTKMKKKALAQQDPYQFIFYKYGNKPQIILDLLNETINVSEGTLKKHGMRTCQQQASLLLRLLKEHKYAHFKRISVTANPMRIGKTPEDREITFQAIKRLFNDPMKHK